nr:hypothetical protein [Pontiella desulfatans]
MKILKARALLTETIDMRRLDIGMPVATEIPVPLIVGHDQYDIGAAARKTFRFDKPGAQERAQQQIRQRLHFLFSIVIFLPRQTGALFT